MDHFAPLRCRLFGLDVNCMSVSSRWRNVICKLENMRPVLTRLKSHCGPGVRKVKELPLRSDLNNTRGEVHNYNRTCNTSQLQKPIRPVQHGVAMSVLLFPES